MKNKIIFIEKYDIDKKLFDVIIQITAQISFRVFHHFITLIIHHKMNY